MNPNYAHAVKALNSSKQKKPACGLVLCERKM